MAIGIYYETSAETEDLKSSGPNPKSYLNTGGRRILMLHDDAISRKCPLPGITLTNNIPRDFSDMENQQKMDDSWAALCQAILSNTYMLESSSDGETNKKVACGGDKGVQLHADRVLGRAWREAMGDRWSILLED
ncbi:hypothetical protein NC653_015108 [Populus alba x Populus x berolinensis]|uniref:Uncharacterized protein n=1 Tax=Populus alba x Populus x berolinensis TaxID=444605 RepID=A0AAD6QZR9_9ROSI|nr:hypothetical protein NC653_015108 [Populus alba x Populus x berolinensis]